MMKMLFRAAIASISVLISFAAHADVEVQCQMGSSCVYQKVLARTAVKQGASGTIINARIRSCVKNFGPPNTKTGRYPVPSRYSCQLSDDLNTEYVIASCNRMAPFVGGYDSTDGKWHLRQVVVPGTKHTGPDLVTYFMICHEYEGRGDLLRLAKTLGYNLPEQAMWAEDRPPNINETGQEERRYGSLEELAATEMASPSLADQFYEGSWHADKQCSVGLDKVRGDAWRIGPNAPGGALFVNRYEYGCRLSNKSLLNANVVSFLASCGGEAAKPNRGSLTIEKLTDSSIRITFPTKVYIDEQQRAEISGVLYRCKL